MGGALTAYLLGPHIETEGTGESVDNTIYCDNPPLQIFPEDETRAVAEYIWARRSAWPPWRKAN